MKNYPNSPINFYHIVKVLEEFLFSRQFWSDYLSHTFTLPYFFAWVKYCAFLSGAVIEYPDIVTLAYSEFTEFWLIHIFTMINTGRQLIEEFHDTFLAESEIFSSPGVVIISALESHLESASIESMSYLTYCTKLESIALCYRVEGSRTSECT